jgi:uncharacterized membrane protein
MALKIVRFANLLLASVLAGNAVGTVVLVNPALGTLPTRSHVEAERAITRRYLPIMRVLMPVTVASCLAQLGLWHERRDSTSFRLTLAGTAGFIGMLGVTLIEIPINRRTLDASPESPPADWAELRARWERFNLLRTGLEVAGLICLYLGALSEAREEARN